MLMRLKRSEEGMALVVSMLVVFIVMLLSTVVVARAISSSSGSAYNRKRVLSVNAAEAGINHFFSHMATVDVDELSCLPVTQSLETSPGTATFTATPTFYWENGDPVPCSSDPTPFNDNVYPAAVLVQSVGQTNGDVPRTMQTYMLLTPIRQGFKAAIVATTTGGLTLRNSMTVNGDSTNDADVFVPNGPLTIQDSTNVYGNVYVGGTCPTGITCGLTMTNQSRVWGNAWIYHGASISNPARVNGNVISSVSSLTGNGWIGGNATAGTTIANSLNVSGTKSPNTVSPPPPTQVFPEVRWEPDLWTNPPDGSDGYTIQPFSDCPSAKSYMLGTSPHSGNTVIWIDAVCPLTFLNNDQVNFNGNLAVVTRGSISMQDTVKWNGQGGTRDLFFTSVWQDSVSYPTDCASGSYNIADSDNVQYNNVRVSFYSPCTVTINNKTNVSGQVIAANVVINNKFTMNFKPVLIPGHGSIVGFEQDIVYIREVRGS